MPALSRTVGAFMSGVWVLLAALAVAAALALWHRRTDGRLRPAPNAGPRTDGRLRATADRTTRGPGTSTSEDLRPLLPEAGERATLLQFSSAFCAPCRATKRVLHEVATHVPGVMHVEVDAESRLDLVRRLDIVKTPTTLVLDADGREVLRASGQPRKDEVLNALAQAVG